MGFSHFLVHPLICNGKARRRARGSAYSSVSDGTTSASRYLVQAVAVRKCRFEQNVLRNNGGEGVSIGRVKAEDGVVLHAAAIDQDVLGFPPDADAVPGSPGRSPGGRPRQSRPAPPPGPWRARRRTERTRGGR